MDVNVAELYTDHDGMTSSAAGARAACIEQALAAQLVQSLGASAVASGVSQGGASVAATALTAGGVGRA